MQLLIGCHPEKGARAIWANQTKSGQNKFPPTKHRADKRSKTYAGLAEAMADQWYKIISPLGGL